MPQLIPFYFLNQVTSIFLLLILIIYIYSKYILPRFARLYFIRTYLRKI